MMFVFAIAKQEAKKRKTKTETIYNKSTFGAGISGKTRIRAKAGIFSRVVNGQT